MKIITTESGIRITEILLMPTYTTFDDCKEDAAHYQLLGTGLDLSQPQAVEIQGMGNVKDVDAAARAIGSLARRLFGTGRAGRLLQYRTVGPSTSIIARTRSAGRRSVAG